MSMTKIAFDSSSLACLRCHQLCEKPTMTRCQHLFCKVCIEGREPKVCPTCRVPFKAKHLHLSSIHQELIDKVKCTQQEVHPVEPCDSSASLYQKLKFPTEGKEIRRLKRIFLQGAIEKDSEERILLRFVKCINEIQDGTPFNKDEELLLFQMLFNVIAVKGVAEPETLRGNLKALIHRLHRPGLPIDLHIHGFDVFRRVLISIPTPKDHVFILNTLVILSNHQKFPVDRREHLLFLINHYSQSYHKHNLLLKFIEDHSLHNPCQQEMLSLYVGELLSELTKESTSIRDQQQLISTIYYLFRKNHLTEKELLVFTRTLLDIISNPDLHPLHMHAIRTLLSWIRTSDSHHCFTLTDERKSAFDAIIRSFKACPATKIQTEMIEQLFSPRPDLMLEAPYALYFFNAHLALMQDTNLPSSTLEALTSRMIYNLPGSQDHMRVTVLYLMLERLHNPNVPMSVKKMYVHTLTDHFNNRHYEQIMQTNLFALRSLKELRRLEPLQNNPELLQITADK